MTGERRKVLAVASGGGHWIQLKRILPAFEGHRLLLVTTEPERRGELESERFFAVRDASRWTKALKFLPSVSDRKPALLFLIVGGGADLKKTTPER